MIMLAHVRNITDLLNKKDTTYVIPVFQRYYEWSEDECTKLFTDLERIATSEKKHFIGTITCDPSDNVSEPVYTIVDGQQRMTSILLLMRAIYDSTYDPLLQKEIRNSFFFNFDDDMGDTKVKLKQVDSDQGIFEKLLLQNEFDESKFNNEEKKTVIYRNYRLFYELLHESNVELRDLYDALFRLEVIEIELEDENPQEVFESMNSTGKPLSNTDLLRNYILMNYSEKKQAYLHKHFWLEIEKYTGRDGLERFMMLYVIMKRKNNQIIINRKRAKISEKNLYDVFKNYLYNQDIEAFLEDVLRFARIYRHLSDDTEMESLVGIRELGCEPAMIFLMYLYDLYEQKRMSKSEFEESVKLIESFILRSKIVKGKQSDQFFSLCISNFEKSAMSSCTEKTADALTSGNGSYRFPTDYEFMETLAYSNLYLEFKQPIVNYILFKLERRLSKEVVSKDGATIEHILPQNPTGWKDLEYEYQNYIHHLGNLTLTKENSELSNKTYEEKKKIYEKSNFALTRNVAKYYKEWNISSIVERTHSMCGAAVDLWPYPEISKPEPSIKERMSEEAKSLYNKLMQCIHEFVFDVEEHLNKSSITLYSNGKAFVSILPLVDSLRVTYYSGGIKSDNALDISNLRHSGIGDTLMHIRNENDLYSFVAILQNLV